MLRLSLYRRCLLSRKSEQELADLSMLRWEDLSGFLSGDSKDLHSLKDERSDAMTAHSSVSSSARLSVSDLAGPLEMQEI